MFGPLNPEYVLGQMTPAEKEREECLYLLFECDSNQWQYYPIAGLKIALGSGWLFITEHILGVSDRDISSFIDSVETMSPKRVIDEMHKMRNCYFEWTQLDDSNVFSTNDFFSYWLNIYSFYIN